MSVEVDSTPLDAIETQLLNDQIGPILRTVLPPDLIPRAFTAIRAAIEQSKKRQGQSFGGMLPNSGQLGIGFISPREFDLATTWTLRSNWSSSSWQTLLSSKTLSKYTHLVVLGYEDTEAVVRPMAVKQTAGGSEQPITELIEMRKSDKHFQPIEPFIAGPISTFTLEVFLDTTGYSNFRPWGFVIAPYAYLVSKTYLS